MRKNHKIVAVDWLDAGSDGEWVTAKDIAKMKPEPTRSIGFLVRDDDIVVVLAQTRNNDHLGDCIIIPRGMVRRVKVLG